METETVHHNPITPSEEYGLNAVHLLRPTMSNVMIPTVVNNAIPVEQAADIPVFSTNNGAIDGNKILQTMSSFNTGERYKRETSLKFSDCSVELYESFRSQFNIHQKMLGWDTRKAGVELYMRLGGKTALKIDMKKSQVKSWLWPYKLTLSKCCQTLNQMMINQYHRQNLSSIVQRVWTIYCTHASSLTKRWMQKKKSSILTWI